MKASKRLICITMGLLLSSAAQGAATGPQPSHGPVLTGWNQGSAAALFPLPAMPNPWESPDAHMPAAGAIQVLQFPPADMRFADGATGAHGMQAKAEQAPVQASAVIISEPASEVLMLIGLSALAIAIRRKMPE